MARSRTGHLRNYIIPEFGKRPISGLNPVEIENWLVVLPLANGTKNDILYTLNIVLREAKREKLLKIWTGLKYASLFHTMATTGIRSGEARALQWQDVSWDLKGLLILRAIKFGEHAYSPLNKHTLLDRFRFALEAAEIEIQGRNLVPHSFRHGYVTLVREVLPEKILREFTGHRSEAMTERYDHPALEDRLKKLAGSRDLIQDVWK